MHFRKKKLKGHIIVNAGSTFFKQMLHGDLISIKHGKHKQANVDALG
jgi:hypothetical protein